MVEGGWKLVRSDRVRHEEERRGSILRSLGWEERRFRGLLRGSGDGVHFRFVYSLCGL